MGSTFPSMCKLFTIAQEVGMMYFVPSDTPLKDRVPLSFAEAKYQKLLSWMDTLKSDMAREQNSPDHLVMFHMWFHSLTIDIFRPFVQDENDQRLGSFASTDGTPKSIFTTSVKHLKRLALNYNSRQASNPISPFINTSLLHIANVVIKDTCDVDRRFYIIMCARYWQELYVGYPMILRIAQGLLPLAMTHNLLSSEETAYLLEEMRSRGKHHEMDDREIVCNVIGDYELAMDDDKGAHMEALAQKFKAMGW
ncbi:N-terminal fungal transcription regulatory domain-containing protein (zinc finger protein) [Colletotrichum truncatum]|uniref:N-terminal fungal transcription regulatory domain-containing protein (Zinc finger protein) n=1 Tax=Colletotrichum truncatum TaxID=5467 RepID=A0ACC3YUC8_COLTU